MIEDGIAQLAIEYNTHENGHVIIVGCTTAAEMWKKLCAHYKESGFSTKANAINAFISIDYTDPTTIKESKIAFNNTVTGLEKLSFPLHRECQRSKLTIKSTPPTLVSFQADIADESRNQAKTSSTTGSALTAHNTKSKKKDRVLCKGFNKWAFHTESGYLEVFPKLKEKFFKRKAAITTNLSDQSDSDSDNLAHLSELSNNKRAYMMSGMCFYPAANS
ncbi:hypothetical protein BELL_1191g00020 [Botrytis elliptica]|uniref:Uncharacterized protein n=1 Tax=Botrytis elliptica TaxID=278938 RepID=A0A4Z1IVU1_9HELO|nr:hypothetical protein EAE99_003394 [Botrytis elliptica]TGO60687.1 hypothetical protein BELL_1191g00020 [Botrytis elliptica]